MISNLFEQYIEQKKEMLNELAAGKVQKAIKIKDTLIQHNNSIKDEIIAHTKINLHHLL